MVVVLVCAASIGIARPRGGWAPSWPWVALSALAALLVGAELGAVRLGAIERGAFDGPVGKAATVRGFVTAVPRRASGRVAVRIQTRAGRLAVEAVEPVPDLPIGREVVAFGTIRTPAPWEAGYLERYGIREILEARRVELTGGRRGGLAAIADHVRDRAEVALGRGTPGPEEALLRGFLLGEDDRIDPATVDDFKRSGLAHLLAVSGDTVMLLGLLTVAVLSLVGVPLKTRLICVLALIALYVPVTGAGPSIQRAGIMGATGVVAALAGRPRARWYAVLLAAVPDPRPQPPREWRHRLATQLRGRDRDPAMGFAVSQPPARAGGLVGDGRAPSARRGRRGDDLGHPGHRSADGERVRLDLDRLSAGQHPRPARGGADDVAGDAAPASRARCPRSRLEPLTWLAGLLAAYVAQVAHWLGSPSWARLNVPLDGAPAVAAPTWRSGWGCRWRLPGSLGGASCGDPRTP